MEVASEQYDWGEREWSPAEFDELTDCAERIRAPLDHQLYFDLSGGDLYCNTASDGSGLMEIAETSLRVAIEATKIDPRWAVEALRRRIEYEELQQVIGMPDGQMLVLSPTPDAVIDGDYDLGVGYNITKKSIMLRLWKRSGDEFACRYISLNGGNKDGLVAGITELDQALPDGMGSEDWLRGRWQFSADLDVAGTMIAAYDNSMHQKFGGNWHYGMEAISEASALTLVSRWPDLLQEHMARLSAATTPAEKEILRYNYAAAIEARRAGDFDIDMDAAGDIARANGEDFAGYCETISVQTNQEALNELGLNHKKWMRCPYCGGSVFGDPCSPGICPHCGSVPGSPTPGIGKKDESTDGQSAEDKPSTVHALFAPDQEITKETKPEKTPDDLAIEALLERNWRVVRSGLLYGIEALVDDDTGELIAVGVKAKNLEYLRQERDRVWFKIA
jgi:rubrerythrin